MKELSLNILDVAENSISAAAKNIVILLDENSNGILTVRIKDDGCGMTPDVVKNVIDPFYTTRSARCVGFGIPMFKLAAEQAGGSLSIKSNVKRGTEVTAVFDTRSVDFTPIGDMVSTIVALIISAPNINFEYLHKKADSKVVLSTFELREILGDISLGTPEVIQWIRDYLTEQYNNFGGETNEDIG